MNTFVLAAAALAVLAATTGATGAGGLNLNNIVSGALSRNHQGGHNDGFGFGNGHGDVGFGGGHGGGGFGHDGFGHDGFGHGGGGFGSDGFGHGGGGFGHGGNGFGSDGFGHGGGGFGHGGDGFGHGGGGFGHGGGFGGNVGGFGGNGGGFGGAGERFGFESNNFFGDRARLSDNQANNLNAAAANGARSNLNVAQDKDFEAQNRNKAAAEKFSSTNFSEDKNFKLELVDQKSTDFSHNDGARAFKEDESAVRSSEDAALQANDEKFAKEALSKNNARDLDIGTEKKVANNQRAFGESFSP